MLLGRGFKSHPVHFYLRGSYGIILSLFLGSCRTEYIAIYRNAGMVITSTITIGFVDIATTTMELLLKLIACEERGFRN
jgi:hypothetical protein